MYLKGQVPVGNGASGSGSQAGVDLQERSKTTDDAHGHTVDRRSR